jgi:hypothetical protein
VQGLDGAQQHAAVGGRGERRQHAGAHAVAQIGDLAGQGRQARFLGQGGLHGVDNVPQQHVEVAYLAELRGQRGHRLAQSVTQRIRQCGREQAQRGPQSAHGDAHLVDVLDIVGVQRTVVIPLQVLQAGKRDMAKGIEGAHPRQQRDGRGLYRRRRRAAVQPIAALGLGEDRRRQGHAVRQLGGDAEQGLYRRAIQFQFDFRDGLALAIGDHPAAIQGEQHRAGLRRQLPGDAPKPRFADGQDARQQSGAPQPLAQFGRLDGEKSKWPA